MIPGEHCVVGTMEWREDGKSSRGGSWHTLCYFQQRDCWKTANGEHQIQTSSRQYVNPNPRKEVRLEDPRLSRMYLALYTGNVRRMFSRLWTWCTMHFGFVVLLGLVLLCCGLVVGWRAHERGRFARLKVHLKEGQKYQEQKSPQPGGQDAVVLQRSQISGGMVPEFLSTTLLPGRGMNVLQITAFLPEKGEITLLDAPGLEDATAKMTGTGEDINGGASLLGNPLELPWAGRVLGLLLEDRTSVQANWHGRSIALPVSGGRSQDGQAAQAVGGLLLKQASTSMSANTMPDGGEVQATYAVGNFDERWPSRTSVTTTVLLSRTVIDLKVLTRNTGTEDEPVGIGWAPRFRLLGAERSQTMLKLPSATRAEWHSGEDRVPTGKFVPVTGTPYDFTARGGTHLNAALDDTFVDLHAALFDLGPVVEIRQPSSNFGIRLTAMAPMIKAIHVVSPTDAKFISVSEQSNLDDPFGREWIGNPVPSILTLHPGEAVQWTVRLEIFPLSS